MGFNKSRALEEAARLVSQRKLPQAIKCYQAILAQDPKDFLLRNIIGDLWVREDNVAEALREFYTLADAYTREGFILKAIAIYKKIAKLDTRSPAPLVKLADLYATQKLSHEASEQYAQALALCEKNSLRDQAGQILSKLVARDPTSAAYRLRLAEILQRAGKLTEACQSFLEAEELFVERHDLPAASAALKKAGEIEPKNHRVLLGRMRLAIEARQYETADEIFRREPVLHSDPEARDLLLTAYLRSRRFDEAAALAVESCRAGSEGFESVARLAAYHLQARDPDAALTPLTGVADLVIQRNQTRELLGLLHQLLAGHPKHASSLDLIQSLCDRAGDREVPPGLLEDLGKAFARVGQWRKAEKVFQRLVGRDEKNQAWQALLTDAIKQQGGGRAAERVSEPEIETPPAGDHPAVEAFPVEPLAEVSDAAQLGARRGEKKPAEEWSVESAASPPAVAIPPACEGVEVDLSAEWDAFAAPAVRPGEEEPAETGPEVPVSPALPTTDARPGDRLGSFPQDVAAALDEARDASSSAQPGPQDPLPLIPSIFDPSLEALLSELDAGPEAPPDEDSPQTHYNLGIAFHEMGLLDEAIGEFQKVVKDRTAADRSLRFLEAASRLGNCFMEKQMPEMAVRWYLRALEAPDLEEEIVLALTYDLGVAYEQCGNVKAAQEKFSEVYSLNIDYRDVAQKVHLLRPERA